MLLEHHLNLDVSSTNINTEYNFMYRRSCVEDFCAENIKCPGQC